MLPVEVKRELDVLSRKGRLQLEKECFQHGDTTVLEHSIKVAVLSLWLVKFIFCMTGMIKIMDIVHMALLIRRRH